MRGVQCAGEVRPGRPPAPAGCGHGLAQTGSPVAAHGPALVNNPQQRVGSCSSPSLCLPMTLASIRIFGHLVAWCGLGSVPEISWACQLDQSVCPAIRALRRLPLSIPGVLALLTAFPRPRNSPASPLCKQPSHFPVHSCQDGATSQGWLHVQDVTAELKGQIWVKKVMLGMDTFGRCPLCVFYGQYVTHS